MKSILAIVFLLWGMVSSAQAGKHDKDFLVSFMEFDSIGDIYGYKDTTGKIVIPAKYHYPPTDTFYAMAIVFAGKEGFVAIDRKEKILFHVFPFDNGPDYVVEGLFRFSDHGKIGYANMKGEKVIPDTFDFARPFSEGLAAFSEGGRKIKCGEEHTCWAGGCWGFINKSGEVVIKPQFKEVLDFENDQCEVWTLYGDHVLIDKKGNIIKRLPGK